MKGTTRMRVTYGNWRVWAVRAAGVAVAALAACGPAHAFYWYDWPGSQLRVQQTLIAPRHQDAPGNPPGTLTPGQPPAPGSVHEPPPPNGAPVPIDKPPVGPNPTPEPATGLLGLIGLSAVAAVRRWRKRA